MESRVKHLDLYVVADREAVATTVNLEKTFCDHFDRSVETVSLKEFQQSVITTRYKSRNLFGSVIGHSKADLVLWNGCAVTKLSGELSPSEMRKDISLEFRELRPYKKTLYSYFYAKKTAAADAWASLVLAFPLATIACGILFRRELTTSAAKLKTTVLVTMLAMATAFCVYFYSYSSIKPKVQVSIFKGNISKALGIEEAGNFLVRLSKFKNEGGVADEKAIAEILTHSRLLGRPNPYTGHPIVLEDSPGNLTLASESGRIFGGQFYQHDGSPILINSPHINQHKCEDYATYVRGNGEEVQYPADLSWMVKIPAGTFMMGSDLTISEQPVQEIDLDMYKIDLYPVTNAEFEEFVEATGFITDAEKNGGGQVLMNRRWINMDGANWRMPDGLNSIAGKMDHPVVQVSYNDAMVYCRWAGKDLPTEAQWEKAARWTDGRRFPWGDFEPDETLCNFDGIIDDTTPVGKYSKGRSCYGVYDMAGNIYEWCRDWYGTGKRVRKNPTGPQGGDKRVVKGGSFMESIEDQRSAARISFEPSSSCTIIGFRCAGGADITY